MYVEPIATVTRPVGALRTHRVLTTEQVLGQHGEGRGRDLAR